MNKKYLMMTVLLLASVFIVAGVRGISSVTGEDNPDGQVVEESSDSVTIYVMCEEGPFIWTWGSENNDYNSQEEWPGTQQLTKSIIYEETGEVFWTYTFPADALPISLLFNNGDPNNPLQTANVTDVTSDRYFTLSWNNGRVLFEDVTEQYGKTIPDAEIQWVGLATNHNNWNYQKDVFDEVEEGKTYEISVDLSGFKISDNRWRFKFCPNGSNWVGYSNVTIEKEPKWLEGYDNDDNFVVNLDVTNDRVFNITATWGGGKSTAENWALSFSSSAGQGTIDPEPEVKDTMTVYVHSRIAPYLFKWNDCNEADEWPGEPMTEQQVVNGVPFWCATVATSCDYINIIFNNGNGYQTDDINGVKGTRYYRYDGLSTYEDITDKVLNGEYTLSDTDKTDLLVNPSFNNGILYGWGYSNVWAENELVLADNNEFEFYQDVVVPTAGLYEVQVQGYQEMDADRFFNDGERDLNVYLFANDNATLLKGIYDEKFDYETVQNMQNEYGDAEFNEWCSDDGCYFYPSWTSGARAAFNNGNYKNSVYVYVPNDSATIHLGVMKSYSDNYNVAYWDNFKLFYWGSDATKAAEALSQAIATATQLKENNLITDKGKNLLTDAIAAANAKLQSTDVTEIMDAIAALNAVVANVKANNMLIVKQYTIPYSRYYTYYNNGDSIVFDEDMKLFFNFDNNSSQPYSSYSNLYFQNGVSLTFTSEKSILDIRFNSTYNSVAGVTYNGTLTEDHWNGDANEVIILNTTSYQQAFNQFTVTFDNPTVEDLLERLNDQVDLAEAAIAALTHQNIYGKDALTQTVAEAKAVAAADSVDVAQVKAYTRQLKADIENLQGLEVWYTLLESSLNRLASAGQDNMFCAPDKLAAAIAYAEEVQAAITAGSIKNDDVQAIFNKIDWHQSQLQMVYLTINLGDPGTLGDEVLSRVTNFTDVQGLCLSGRVDASDMEILKNQMTKLQEVDLTGTNLKSIPYQQFYNRYLLTSVKLPANLETIEGYAFYGCANLEQMELPATLKTIGEEAFYNCSKFTELTIPEGVTTIGSYAYYCSTSTGYAYDNNGNYAYDDNGNRIRLNYASQLKKVTLPSTLTSLGYAAFSNCRNLQEVNFAEGLKELQSETFENCKALKSITLPATIKKIGSEAFNGSGLVNVELPEGLNVIQSYAFGNCDSLRTITLPSSVNSIVYPFSDCDNLTSIIVNAIAPPYANDNDIMGGREQQCTLYVPELSLASYKQTDRWSKFAPNILGMNIMPENIIITDEYRLLWPDTVSFDYKPNVELTKMDRGSNYYGSRYRYAAVTVTGNATLSAKEFSMYYDYYFKYNSGSSSDSRFATLINNGKIRTDNNTLKLHLYANRWNFLALPFDVKVSDIANVNNTQFVVRGYDVKKRADGVMDSTWYNMTSDDILEAGKGYIWQGAHTTYTDENGYTNTNYDIEFDVQALQTVNKNNMFRNGDIEIELQENLSEFPQNRNWNFIGNPFPSYFDTRAIDCTAPITVWTSSNNYKAYSPVDDSYILAPGEAFFMQRPLDQASITFLRDGRQMTPAVRTDVNYFSATRQSEMTSKRYVFNLTVEGLEQSDVTRFVINEEASLAYEMDKDASKFMDATASGIQLYTVENGLRYAINERPLSGAEVALGMKIAKAGTYTITLDTKADAEVYLVDLLTGEKFLMGENGYTFQAEAGTLDSRFIIVLAGGEPTGIETIANSQDANNIYDLQGRRIEKNQMRNGVYVQKGKKTVVK